MILQIKQRVWQATNMQDFEQEVTSDPLAIHGVPFIDYTVTRVLLGQPGNLVQIQKKKIHTAENYHMATPKLGFAPSLIHKVQYPSPTWFPVALLIWFAAKFRFLWFYVGRASYVDYAIAFMAVYYILWFLGLCSATDILKSDGVWRIQRRSLWESTSVQ